MVAPQIKLTTPPRVYRIPPSTPLPSFVDRVPRMEVGPNVDSEDERLKAYDALSRVLRASFCSPIPGSRLENPEDVKNWPSELTKRAEAKESKEKEQVDEALVNYAVLLLEPRGVDVVELRAVPNLRTKYVEVEDRSPVRRTRGRSPRLPGTAHLTPNPTRP